MRPSRKTEGPVASVVGCDGVFRVEWRLLALAEDGERDGPRGEHHHGHRDDRHCDAGGGEPVLRGFGLGRGVRLALRRVGIGRLVRIRLAGIVLRRDVGIDVGWLVRVRLAGIVGAIVVLAVIL